MAYGDKEKQRIAVRRHYLANRDKIIKRSIARKKARTAIMANIKATTPCMDCHNIFPPECMDFDHVRGEKEFEIGSSCDVSEEKLQRELAKCELVCANCHRIRTRKRIHSLKDRILGFEPSGEGATPSGSTNYGPVV